jgi:hypothetical protein
MLRKLDDIIMMCACDRRSQTVDPVVQRVHFVYNVRLRDDVSFVTKDPIRFELLLCQAQVFLGTFEFEL